MNLQIGMEITFFLKVNFFEVYFSNKYLARMRHFMKDYIVFFYSWNHKQPNTYTHEHTRVHELTNTHKNAQAQTSTHMRGHSLKTKISLLNIRVCISIYLFYTIMIVYRCRKISTYMNIYIFY